MDVLFTGYPRIRTAVGGGRSWSVGSQTRGPGELQGGSRFRSRQGLAGDGKLLGAVLG